MGATIIMLPSHTSARATRIKRMMLHAFRNPNVRVDIVEGWLQEYDGATSSRTGCSREDSLLLLSNSYREEEIAYMLRTYRRCVWVLVHKRTSLLGISPNISARVEHLDAISRQLPSLQ